MNKLSILLLATVLWAGGAAAQALTVFADKAYRPALREIVPQFTAQTGFEVQLTCGRSAALAARIVRAETPPDVFFPAEAAASKCRHRLACRSHRLPVWRALAWV